jgi:hypothetical protein
MLSWVPVPSSFLNTSRSWPAFCPVICVSGLNRCASYVRLYISQSSGLGFASISPVTGRKARAGTSATGASCALEGGESASRTTVAVQKNVRAIDPSLICVP